MTLAGWPCGSSQTLTFGLASSSSSSSSSSSDSSTSADAKGGVSSTSSPMMTRRTDRSADTEAGASSTFSPMPARTTDRFTDAKAGASSTSPPKAARTTDHLGGAAAGALAIYNESAIGGDYVGAEFDQYGCPIGDFDLARDGSFEGYCVLMGVFYMYEGLPEDLAERVIPELEKKGFLVDLSYSMDEFTALLKHDIYHVAWIVSGWTLELHDDADVVEQFIQEVGSFHETGHGLMIWGENDPLFVHANLILHNLFDFMLTGDTPGNKNLCPGDPDQPGCFDRSHKVCAGIECLHEGITVCYPTKVPTDWRVFGTSSDCKPVLLAKEAGSEVPHISGTGRVIVDTGFTKIMRDQWDTAGTARYVINCTTWLVLRERFGCPDWH
mmetsp:Transcript_38124/g.97415  ORF Transcript_38124/g.97415 Transcript_38124/m.97415 type:complete len:383 (-) Transcript_38124:137-1285(-)